MLHMTFKTARKEKKRRREEQRGESKFFHVGWNGWEVRAVEVWSQLQWQGMKGRHGSRAGGDTTVLVFLVAFLISLHLQDSCYVWGSAWGRCERQTFPATPGMPVRWLESEKPRTVPSALFLLKSFPLSSTSLSSSSQLHKLDTVCPAERGMRRLWVRTLGIRHRDDLGILRMEFQILEMCWKVFTDQQKSFYIPEVSESQMFQWVKALWRYLSVNNF